MAVVVGLVLSPFLARLLPFGLDGRMAATIMGAGLECGGGVVGSAKPGGLARPRVGWQNSSTTSARNHLSENGGSAQCVKPSRWAAKTLTVL